MLLLRVPSPSTRFLQHQGYSTDTQQYTVSITLVSAYWGSRRVHLENLMVP